MKNRYKNFFKVVTLFSFFTFMLTTWQVSAQQIAPWLDDVETHATTTNSTITTNGWSSTPTGTSTAYRWDIDGAGSTPSGSTGPSGAFSGTNYFYTEASSGSAGDVAELISPQIDLTALTNPVLEFRYHMYGQTMGDLYIEVFNGTVWTVVDSIKGEQHFADTDPWSVHTIYLSSFPNLIQVKFRSIRSTNFYGDMSLDNIEFKEAAACPAPTFLTASNFTPTSADLAWTENGTATSWDIEWGAAGFTPTGTPNVVGTTTNPHNLTGLTANTSYDYYVRADCGGSGTSTWAGPFSFATPCASQLAGTYTIGTTGNYATFTDAVNDLSCGISAPVIFNVLAGSGPFNEQITLAPVTGASATNTITFNGNGETITFSTSTSPDNYIIRLDGADYITFDNLNVVAQSTTNNFAIHLINDADFNTINNCTIDLTSTFSSTGTTNGGIVVSGSLTSATTAGASGTDNTFTNNTIIGGYYGITINGASATVNSLNNTVTNNNVQDFYSYGLYFRSASNSIISNNEVSRMTRTPLTSFYGIYFITSGENNLIEANEIHDAFTGEGGNSTSLAYTIYHSSVDATVGNANKVVNNLIYNINTNGTIYGFYNLGSDGVHYYHNTVSIDDAASTAGTTRGFYQTTTASDIEFKNNIVSVTRGGTGTKHCIYFNAAASTITSNNNVFYINAPAGTNNLGYFSATNQATLLDWQTASSQDASSSDANPIYANLLSNDLTPTNGAIDGIADATVGVVNDFYGIARAVTPDPGAIEFMPPTCSQPSVLTAINITTTSADLGWTENGTATTWDIEWGTVGFTPTGTPTILGTTTNPHNLTGLTAQTSYDFYVRADCGGSGTSNWSGPFTFTTECNAVVAPWIESFENAGAIPACWSQGALNAKNWLFTNTGAGNHIGSNGTITGTTTSGNYFAWVDDSSPHSVGTTLESPFIDVTALTNPMLSFFLISDNEGNSNVDFSVDVWDGAAWNTGVYTSNTNTLNGGWEQINVYLSSLTITGDIKLRFIVDENNGTGFYDDVAIDDVEIKEAPSCPAPSALIATNIAATSADLGWTENGTATTWDIEWGTVGFTPTGVPTIVGTTTNPHNLTGLTAQTTYDFYVRAMCSASDSSAWVGPFAFTTPCAAVIAPWIESFENAGAIPACWSQGASNGEDWLFANTGAGNHIGNNGTITGTTTSGNFFAWVDDSAPQSLATTLESPFIDVTALTNPMLSFFLISNNEGNSNVTFSVDVWDGAAWNTGVYTSNTNTLNGGWEQINVNLSSLTITGDIRFRFIVDENNGTDFYDDVAIDDVEIKEAPSCPAPSALTATNVTATSADLGWTENGTATTWDIEWGTAGFTPTGVPTILGTTTNPHSVSGLTAQTSYEFYVRAMCSASDSSNWVGPFAFTTPCAVITPNHTEPFNNFVPNACWDQADGGDLISGPTSLGSSPWAASTAIGNTAKINLYTTTRSDWILSPYFDLSAGGYEIVLDVAVTDWNLSGSDVMGSDDSVRVVYTEDGLTWNTLMVFTVADSLSNSLTTFNTLIPSIGNNVQFGILATDGPVNDLEDYDFHVDNFIIRSPITCSDPSNLTAFNVQPTSAMLDWTENGTATNWNIEWDITGFTLGTGNPQAVAAKPYLLQGLSPGTAYDYYVQADCGLGDTSNWVGPFTFTTPPCIPIVVDLGVDTTVCSNDSILLDAGGGGNYTYSWSTGGTAQTELVDTNLMGGNGTYNISVMVTDVVTGCMYTDDINVTFQVCTDIDELGNENAIAIYPNPTNGLLNVMINGATINTMLTIVDVQGKVIYAKNNFTNSTSLIETIDLSGNDKGIYFITLTTEKATVVKKVILH